MFLLFSYVTGTLHWSAAQLCRDAWFCLSQQIHCVSSSLPPHVNAFTLCKPLPFTNMHTYVCTYAHKCVLYSNRVTLHAVMVTMLLLNGTRCMEKVTIIPFHDSRFSNVISSFGSHYMFQCTLELVMQWVFCMSVVACILKYCILYACEWIHYNIDLSG